MGSIQEERALQPLGLHQYEIDDFNGIGASGSRILSRQMPSSGLAAPKDSLQVLSTPPRVGSLAISFRALNPRKRGDFASWRDSI